MKTDVTLYLIQSTLSSPPMSSFAPNHREGQCQQLGCGMPLRASSQSLSTQPPQRVSIVRPLAPAPGNTVGDSDQSWAHHPAHLPGCSYNHTPLPAFPDSEAEIPPRTSLPNQEASRRRALHSDVSQACKIGLSRRGEASGVGRNCHTSPCADASGSRGRSCGHAPRVAKHVG